MTRNIAPEHLGLTSISDQDVTALDAVNPRDLILGHPIPSQKMQRAQRKLYLILPSPHA